MIIYLERQAQEYEQTKKILSVYKHADIILIDHYKNVFDKTGFNNQKERSIIIAKLTSPSILEAPKNYGHNNEHAYFFKTSLNCVYDCEYCFLKGAFKNDMQVYFVNYDDIKEQIEEKVVGINKNMPVGYECIRTLQDDSNSDYELQLKSNYTNAIWLYSSDYSDILGMNGISGFLEEFVPFFEQLNSNDNRKKDVMMEVRTKSGNIKPILDLGFVPEYTEFAFSLNPQSLIDKYETGTSSLESRINAINTLLGKGYKVGVRFLPLLPVKNYKEKYSQFVQVIGKEINMDNISSSFASGLLFTKSDHKVMLKKYPKLDILYRLQEEQDGFVREEREVRDFFYTLFRKLDKKCYICLDEK